MRKTIRYLSVLLALASVFLFAAFFYADYSLSDNYIVVEGTQLEPGCQIPITLEYEGEEASQKTFTAEEARTDYNVNFKLLGVFPVGSANVSVVSPMSVRVIGEPFGIKIYTDGVMVVKTEDVDGKDGSVNPSKRAGVRIGDTIKSINGKRVYSNEDVAGIVEESNGKALKLKILRDGTEIDVKIKPVYSERSGIYRLGIWVRDSTAGIGTLTFYSPSENVVCGLGHGVCDSDTKELLSVSFGEIVNADIVAKRKGAAGDPGELKGRLTDVVLGDIVSNNDRGVYAKAQTDFCDCQLMEIAVKQEITNGPAYIYTTIDGETPQYYTCNVEIRKNYLGDKTHNMTVTVTDAALLSETGGIVQGMSGSPLLQNGKLIGAVTHVCVNP